MRKILKKYKKLILLLAALMAVSTLAYGAGHYYIKYSGLNLKASKNFKPQEVAYYLQWDPEWSDDRIGESDSSMGGAGCLVTSVASAANALGFAITPKDLNRKLTEAGAYAGDRLIWTKLSEILPGLGYSYKRIFSASTMEKDLADGRLPIVSVRFLGDGVTHWVLIVGAEDGEFMIYDPANSAKTYLPLSRHGKVYAYRVLKKT